ncbi:MAG: hypothetical protein IJ551_02285 [Prevotella sp.]|nr:hypothetical protein [Prevotella sp.]
MKRILLTFIDISFCMAVAAQVWNEDFANRQANLSYESENPTRLSYNQQQDFAVTKAGYFVQNGDFRAIDQSSNAHGFDVYIGGLRKVQNFSLSGHIRYLNEKDKEQSWNSTLWNLADNPFTLCDSVPGDATTESFDMQAAAAYDFGNRLKAGLSVGLRSGSRADQTDPRPRTTASHLPITAGVDYQVNRAWNVGLSAGVKFSSSIIEYTLTQNNFYRYFLMKGMGDYAKRSTSDESGYKRDYQGTHYQAALNAVWQSADGRMGNFIEIGYQKANEDATDGGLSYSFHGGDYAAGTFSLQNRFRLQPSENMIHNLTIRASYSNGKGTWYDQKRRTDIEHGSIIYYEVLSKNTIHKSQRLDARLQYQIDLLRNGQRDLFVRADAQLNGITRKQLLGNRTPKQEIQNLSLQLQAGKVLYINKVALLAQVGGGYLTPQKQTYASGSLYTGVDNQADNIDAVYTRRVFEYESAQRWNIGALIDASLPLSNRLKAGLYAQCQYNTYNGKSEYWNGYDGTHQTAVDLGLYLQF